MPWFRATVVDQNKNRHVTEFYAGCPTGAQQLLMAKFGVTKHKYGAPIGGKVGIIIKDLKEIDPPK